MWPWAIGLGLSYLSNQQQGSQPYVIGNDIQVAQQQNPYSSLSNLFNLYNTGNSLYNNLMMPGVGDYTSQTLNLNDALNLYPQWNRFLGY